MSRVSCRYIQLCGAGRPAGGVALAAVSAVGADFLVMRGRGHDRVREVIRGGCSRRVLTDADMPGLPAG